MKLKSIQISKYLIEKCFSIDYELRHAKVIRGIPKGSRLVDIDRADLGRDLLLTFEHDSFDDLPEGTTPPLIVCQITEYAPIPNSLGDLTQEERQSLYEHLHDQYDCRKYK